MGFARRFGPSLAMVLLLLLTACRGGGSGDGSGGASTLFEISPATGTTTLADTVLVSGRVPIGFTLASIQGQVGPVDPVTGRFELSVPVVLGMNTLRLDLTNAEGVRSEGVRTIEVLRAPGPQTRVETLAVPPGGDRYYFVEDDGSRWLTELDLTTGLRRRLLEIGPATVDGPPVALHWDRERDRLLIGTRAIQEYDPAIGEVVNPLPPLSGVSGPGLPSQPDVLDFARSTNPVDGFVMTRLGSTTSLSGYGFATDTMSPSTIATLGLSTMPTEIAADEINNRLLGAVVDAGTLRLIQYDVASFTWLPLLSLPETGLAPDVLPGSCFATTPRRVVVAIPREDPDGNPRGLRLYSVDINLGTFTSRDITPLPGSTVARRPALAYDELDNAVHLAFGQRFLVIDPTTLATTDSRGAIAPVSTGSSDEPTEGPAYFSPERGELIQTGVTPGGLPSLLATDLVSRVRRRVTTLPPNFSYTPLSLQGATVWGALSSTIPNPGGVGTIGGSQLVRIDLDGNGEPLLLGPLPASTGPNQRLIFANEVGSTGVVRVLWDDGLVFERDPASGVWTLLTALQLPTDTRWRADESGDLFGLQVLTGATESELEAFEVDLQLPAVAPLGSVIVPASALFDPGAVVDPPYHDAESQSLTARTMSPTGEVGLLRLHYAEGTASFTPALPEDRFGALGSTAADPTLLRPTIIRGFAPERPLILFRTEIDQAVPSLGELDLGTAGTTLRLN